VYGFQVNSIDGTFGLLDEFLLAKLKGIRSRMESISRLLTSLPYNHPRDWKGKAKIQKLVSLLIDDCVEIAGFEKLIQMDDETTLSFSRIMAKHQYRTDFTTIVNDTDCITGVIEVKLPGFDMDRIIQLVDYMIDLRNSFNVRFVFGLLTTYEKWRVVWFEDTNDAAQLTSKPDYYHLCHQQSATDHSVERQVSVYTSRVFDYSEVGLLEMLISFLYKSSMSPVSSSQSFFGSSKKYVHVSEDSFTFASLPKDLHSFSYQMPDVRSKNYYILQYYHQGGDGRVALACSSSGRLCVLKFPLNVDGEKKNLQEEANLWNRLWNANCRVIKVKSRHALLMPFCYHVDSSIQDNRLLFRSMLNWNRRPMLPNADINDTEILEFQRLDFVKLKLYQKDPRQAARIALTIMHNAGVDHDDIKWSHVGLMPKVGNEDLVQLKPVMLDLTRVVIPGKQTVDEMLGELDRN
jgi:hypothetical protein